MTIDPKAVLDHIDADELVNVTLDLANLDSPTGSEGPVADYVHDWLVRQGFDARKVGLYPNRPNVMATLPGSGGGRSLCFNSHMDTTIHKDEWWTTRHAADPHLPHRLARGGRARRQRRVQLQGPDGDLAARRQGHQGFRCQAEG
jgi:acetylornithine deacetylase/succinyl-diaminopimelate desuccinylase-like protein